MLEEAWDYIKSRQKMNLLIVIINIVVYAVLEYMGDTRNSLFMLKHGAMYPPYITIAGDWYRLFTSMFMHFGVRHLGYNMLLLLIAGDKLEKQVGKIRYLIICLGGGLIGNVFSLYCAMSDPRPPASAGFSGAVFAVVGALIWLMILNREKFGQQYVLRVMFVAVLTLAEGFSQTGIDNEAHVGGFLGGLALCVLITLLSKNRAQRVPLA